MTLARGVVQRDDDGGGGGSRGKRTGGYHNYNNGFYSYSSGGRADNYDRDNQADADAAGGSAGSSPF